MSRPTRTAAAAVLAAGGFGGLGTGLAACSGGSSYSCCRSGRPVPVVQTTLRPASQPATVRVRPGQTLEVRATGSQEVSVTPPGVVRALNPGPGVLEFRAVRRGQATITVETARCAPQAVRCSGQLRSFAIVVAVS